MVLLLGWIHPVGHTRSSGPIIPEWMRFEGTMVGSLVLLTLKAENRELLDSKILKWQLREVDKLINYSQNSGSALPAESFGGFVQLKMSFWEEMKSSSENCCAFDGSELLQHPEVVQGFSSHSVGFSFVSRLLHCSGACP